MATSEHRPTRGEQNPGLNLYIIKIGIRRKEKQSST